MLLCDGEIPGEPEKSSHFKEFITPRVLHRFELLKFQLRAERLKYVCEFSCSLEPASHNVVLVVRVVQKTRKTKTRSLSLSSFGTFCTTLTT